MSKFMVNFHNMDLKILPIVCANSQGYLALTIRGYATWLNQIFALTRVNIRTRCISQNVEIHYRSYNIALKDICVMKCSASLRQR